jgi:hypothetical protein
MAVVDIVRRETTSGVHEEKCISRRILGMGWD